MELKYDSMKDFVTFWDTSHVLYEFNVLLREFIDEKDSFNEKKARRLLFLTKKYKYNIFDFIEKIREALETDIYDLITEKEFYTLEGRLKVYLED